MFRVFRVSLLGFSWNFSKSQSLKSFLVPGPLHWEEAIYDDSHLASLGAPLFQVPEPIQSPGGEARQFFKVLGPLYREKDINDISYLASLGA